MPELKIINKENLVCDFKAMGIERGDIINLKISLRSIGKVEGGADTVINALLEIIREEGTIVTDSFLKPYPKFSKIFKINQISKADSTSYAGAITNAILKRTNTFRATHPIQRFAAIGKYAKQLTENFTEKSEPYGFLKEMAYLGAKNIRVGGVDKVVGVGTTHIAICAFGFKQKLIPRGVYYIDSEGIKKFFEANWANGCPKGFNNLLNRYEKYGLQIKKGKIGNAESIVTFMKETLEFEIMLFQKEPTAFQCNDPTCTFCSFSWKESKFTFNRAIIESIKKIKIKTLIYFIKLRLFGKDFPR